MRLRIGWPWQQFIQLDGRIVAQRPYLGRFYVLTDTGVMWRISQFWGLMFALDTGQRVPIITRKLKRRKSLRRKERFRRRGM